MRWIGCRHERERPAERIGHLLIVTIVADHSARTPAPIRRQLPLDDMRRQNLGRARCNDAATHSSAQASLRISTISTLVPTPSSLVTAISPPHASISLRVTASPSPLPVVRVEKCGSKILGITAAGIPDPLSKVTIVT